MPQVTVGMPLYNDEKYIREAITSILNQSFTDFELVIADNASTDSSPNICCEYMQNDSRIRYIRHESNLGPTQNFAFLTHEAKGKYFMWAATDDLWDKDFIRNLYHALENDRSCGIAFGPYVFINDEGSPISKPRSFDYSSRFKFIRILKFCFYYDDGFFYGFYKTDFVKQIQFRKWWGVNSKSPMNNAYPPLYNILTATGFAFSNEKPLWFNRIKSLAPNHYIPFRENALLAYFAYLLRLFNLFCFSLQAIYRGSHSPLLVLLVSPFLFIRVIIDAIMLVVRIIYRAIKNFFRVKAK